jgi:membrane-associated HD superfamily phosphohydrolase
MRRIYPLATLMFIATGLAVGGAAYLYGKAYIEIIRIVVAALLGVGVVIFLYAEGREKDNLLQDNAEHFLRFFGYYLLALAVATLFPLLPQAGWPFLVVFVVLGLASNQQTGVCAGATLLVVSLLLTEAPSFSVFFTYLLGGTIGIVLFAYIDESFRVGLPLFVSIMLALVAIAVNLVMTGQTEITFETLFVVMSNMLVCVLLLLVFLRYYSTNVVNLAYNKYMMINDPECPILVELKRRSRNEYYQAVHTAYLSDKIAKKLGLDDMAAKACGYYHKIGVLNGENSWEAINEICRSYRFPAAAIRLLKEYTDSDTDIVSKEAVVVLFADTLVASLLYLFSKDPNVKPDYPQIIDAIYEKKLESGIIDKSQISMGEMKEIRRLLKEEHLYYDFLR